MGERKWGLASFFWLLHLLCVFGFVFFMLFFGSSFEDSQSYFFRWRCLYILKPTLTGYMVARLFVVVVFFPAADSIVYSFYPSIGTTVLGSLDKRPLCNVCLEAERNFTRKMTGKFTRNFKEMPYMNTINISLFGQGRVTLCFIKYKKGMYIQDILKSM